MQRVWRIKKRPAAADSQQPGMCVFDREGRCGASGFAVRLSVQKPHTEIEISGKGDPEQVRDLQPCRKLVDFAERQDHQGNQKPQHKQPEEGKTKCLKIKEKNAPKEVEYQLEEK